MWFGKTSDSARLFTVRTENVVCGKVSRLGERLKDPEWRRYGGLLLAGKLLGIAAVFGVMLAFEIVPRMMGSQTAAAQETPAAHGSPLQLRPKPRPLQQLPAGTQIPTMPCAR